MAADHALRRLVTAVDRGNAIVLPHTLRDSAHLAHCRIRLLTRPTAAINAQPWPPTPPPGGAPRT
ncbi:hypothetical protein [Kitasatospora sp. NPDC001225]